jgi:hypothetical protein
MAKHTLTEHYSERNRFITGGIHMIFKKKGFAVMPKNQEFT